MWSQRALSGMICMVTSPCFTGSLSVIAMRASFSPNVYGMMLSSFAWTIIIGQFTLRIFVVVQKWKPFSSSGSRIVASNHGNHANNYNKLVIISFCMQVAQTINFEGCKSATYINISYLFVPFQLDDIQSPLSWW